MKNVIKLYNHETDDARFNEAVLVHSMDFVGDTDNNSSGLGYDVAAHFDSVLKNTHFEVAASGQYEYAGSYGVFIKGTVTAAYSHDVHSYVKNGKRFASAESETSEMPAQMTYEEYLVVRNDENHIMCEFFVKNYEVLGVWFKCAVPAAKDRILSFLKGKDIPIFDVYGEDVFPYVESEDRLLRRYRRKNALA